MLQKNNQNFYKKGTPKCGGKVALVDGWMKTEAGLRDCYAKSENKLTKKRKRKSWRKKEIETDR